MTIVLLFLGLKDPQDLGLWALKPEISRADEIEQVTLLCPLFLRILYIFFAIPHGLWDLSSPLSLCRESTVLTTREFPPFVLR